MLRLWMCWAVAACSAAPPRREPPPIDPDRVELIVVDPASHLGKIVALLPDGRGLAQPAPETILIVDPATGASQGHHLPALPYAPKYGCDLAPWGKTPALVCETDILYRLTGEEWRSVTRGATHESDSIQLSDDGIHAAYAGHECPGVDSKPGEHEYLLCMFGTSGWHGVIVPIGTLVGIRGATAYMVVGDAGPPIVSRLLAFDAETAAAQPERTMPDFAGQGVFWSSPSMDKSFPLPDGVLYLHARTQQRGFEAVGPGAAGLIAMRRADGEFDVRTATDAPRERWGVRVAFADARHGVAAGSFYRNVYYTIDGGVHWTAIAGLDAARDAQFSSGRIMEDSAMPVHCDAVRTCRVRLHPKELVVRFGGPRGGI